MRKGSDVEFVYFMVCEKKSLVTLGKERRILRNGTECGTEPWGLLHPLLPTKWRKEGKYNLNNKSDRK